MILGWDSMHQSLIWFFCTVFDEELALIGYFEFFGRDYLDDENDWLEWSDGCIVLRIMDMMYFWCILLFLYIYLSHSLLKKLTQFRHNSKIKARSPTSQQNQPNHTYVTVSLIFNLTLLTLLFPINLPKSIQAQFNKLQ